MENLFYLLFFIGIIASIVYGLRALINGLKKNKDGMMVLAKKSGISFIATLIFLIVAVILTPEEIATTNSAEVETETEVNEDNSDEKEEAELKAKKEADEKAQAEAKAKEEADAKAKEEAEAKAKAEAEANKPLDQKALDIANDVMGKDHVIEVKLIENKLFYTLEGKDNFTVNMIRTGMHMYTTEILEKTSALEGYDQVNFVYKMPLIDQLGNESLSDVMSFWLDREIINKINFDNFSSDNIPNISTDYWQHPALNE